MAKTLVVVGADYSSNALDTVVFNDPVPCTAIALNKSSATSTSIGTTEQLVATKTPLDTTDTVTWASSDTDVATVVNGLVTTVGVGTATITVTCGEQTATCTITSKAYMNGSNLLAVASAFLSGGGAADSGNGLASLDTSTTRAGILASSTGSLHLYGSNASNVYPYLLPKGTAQVKVTIPSGSIIAHANCICWFNHGEHAAGYSEVAQCVKVKNSDFTPSGGPYVLDVPTPQGYTIDSFVIGLRAPSGTAITTEALEALIIEFLPASAA